MQRLRLNEPPKRDAADNHTHHICNVIPVALNITRAAAGDAAVLVGFEGAAEGRGDQGGGEGGRRGRGGGRRDAGRDCEVVDEFEDEEAREGAAEVGDAGEVVSPCRGLEMAGVGRVGERQ